MTKLQETVLKQIQRMIEVSGLPSLFASEIATTAKSLHQLTHTQTHKALDQLVESGEIIKVSSRSHYKPDTYKPSEKKE